MRFLLRVLFTALAIWLVTLFVPGIRIVSFGSAWWHIALTTVAQDTQQLTSLAIARGAARLDGSRLFSSVLQRTAGVLQ